MAAICPRPPRSGSAVRSVLKLVLAWPALGRAWRACAPGWVQAGGHPAAMLACSAPYGRVCCDHRPGRGHWSGRGRWRPAWDCAAGPRVPGQVGGAGVGTTTHCWACGPPLLPAVGPGAWPWRLQGGLQSFRHARRCVPGQGSRGLGGGEAGGKGCRARGTRRQLARCAAPTWHRATPNPPLPPLQARRWLGTRCV